MTSPKDNNNWTPQEVWKISQEKFYRQSYNSSIINFWLNHMQYDHRKSTCKGKFAHTENSADVVCSLFWGSNALKNMPTGLQRSCVQWESKGEQSFESHCQIICNQHTKYTIRCFCLIVLNWNQLKLLLPSLSLQELCSAMKTLVSNTFWFKHHEMFKLIEFSSFFKAVKWGLLEQVRFMFNFCKKFYFSSTVHQLSQHGFVSSGLSSKRRHERCERGKC